jgi:hypothetical protein
MKKQIKKEKKEKKQIVEIHIYVHNQGFNSFQVPYNPNPTPNTLPIPPYIVTC